MADAPRAMSSPLYRAAARFAAMFAVGTDSNAVVVVPPGVDPSEFLSAFRGLDAALEAERKEG